MAMDILRVVITIANNVKNWVDANAEVKEVCKALSVNLSVIGHNLKLIQRAIDAGEEKKLPIDALREITLNAKQCLEDIGGFCTQLQEIRKKKWYQQYHLNPDAVIAKLVAREAALMNIVHLLNLSLSTAHFAFVTEVKANPTPPPSAGALSPATPGSKAKATVDHWLTDADAHAFWTSKWPTQVAVPWAQFLAELSKPPYGPFDPLTVESLKFNLVPQDQNDAKVEARVTLYKFQAWAASGLKEAIRAASVDAPADAKEVVPGAAVAPSASAVAGGVSPPPAAAAASAAAATAAEAKKAAEADAAAAAEAAAATREVITVDTPPRSAAVLYPLPPPDDLQLLWSDPNHDSQWNRIFCDALRAAGIKFKCVESAADAISFLTAYPKYHGRSHFRVMSNNAVYNLADGAVQTQSASTSLVVFLRARRSLCPVFIYCSYTLPLALDCIKNGAWKRVHASSDPTEAEAFAQGAPLAWAPDSSAEARAWAAKYAATHPAADAKR